MHNSVYSIIEENLNPESILHNEIYSEIHMHHKRYGMDFVYEKQFRDNLLKFHPLIVILDFCFLWYETNKGEVYWAGIYKKLSVKNDI